MSATQTDMATAVGIHDLHRSYRKTEAVRGLSLAVRPGTCHGLFGRNGAGKTTTIKCMLGHLRPDRGRVSIFGLDPQQDEVGVKRLIGYVPETIGFYPWMTAQAMLDYAASFRPAQWNRKLEGELMRRFELEPAKKIAAMSKGMRAQLALICAIAAEPDLLLLDEPTSGLDPIVRREFIETVIGAYQEGAPERRTVFVSTHLIGEWEGLIDTFTIVEKGQALLTMQTEDARTRFRRLRLGFEGEAPAIATGPGILKVRPQGRTLEILTDDYTPALEARLRAHGPATLESDALTLEEIFVALGARA